MMIYIHVCSLFEGTLVKHFEDEEETKSSFKILVR